MAQGPPYLQVLKDTNRFPTPTTAVPQCHFTKNLSVELNGQQPNNNTTNSQFRLIFRQSILKTNSGRCRPMHSYFHFYHIRLIMTIFGTTLFIFGITLFIFGITLFIFGITLFIFGIICLYVVSPCLYLWHIFDTFGIFSIYLALISLYLAQFSLYLAYFLFI